jgi:uncharacterized protein
MLLRFYVSNFMSFHQEAEFNMFPGALKTHKAHVYKQNKINLLKAAAMYGANGSGKSNFIKAVHFLHDIVVKGDIESSEVRCVPFKLGNVAPNEPSVFGIEIKIEKKYYEYIISIAEDKIINEELYETNPETGDGKMLFSRTQGKQTKITVDPSWTTTDKERYRYEIYAEDLAPSAALLFKLKEHQPDAKRIYDWFEKYLYVIYPESKFFLTLKLCTDDKYKSFLNDLLPALGTGMNKVDIAKIPFDTFFSSDEVEFREKIEQKLKNKTAISHFMRKGKEYVARKEEGQYFVHQLNTFNSDAAGNLVGFDPDEQSDGTRRILDLIPAIQLILDHPTVLFIDEIERSLHPSMIKALLTFLMNQKTKGQLIFTTHESNLLDLSLFRQDEIWFAEKDNQGASTLYPLTNFKPRYDLDIKKGYLLGRFGAIPFLGNFNNLSQEHEPQEQTI